MPNAQGHYTKAEVIDTGLPYYIPASKRWTSKPYNHAVLLTDVRCNQYHMPVQPNEQPSAFFYAASVGKSTGDHKHRYIPLYDRTKELANNHSVRLLPRELMRT